MTCQSCENAVKKALVGVEGIDSVTVDHATEKVVVDTNLPVHTIQELIENTGRKAVVLGLGSGSGISVRGLGAAVAMMDGGESQGVARIVQTTTDNCVIDGTIDGLKPGKYQLKVHQFGDLTKGCDSCGDVYTNSLVKSEKETVRDREKWTKIWDPWIDIIDGDLGTVEANEYGRTEFRLKTSNIKVSDIIGRSMVLHNLAPQQQTCSGRLACGIIARSSGLFENSKRVCACDGITLWDERNVPLAGGKRQNFNMSGKL